MLLAIDTATRMISLALHDGDRLHAEATWETANHHTVELAPAVDTMLRRAKLSIADLQAVAVALGPGSFTGLRIGLGLAKGLAVARGLTLLGIPTLEILAKGQPPFDGTLIAVLQAGRGRICAQSFAWEGTAWTPQADPAIMSWQALMAAVDPGTPTCISGEIDAEGLQQIGDAITAGKLITLAAAANRLRRAGYLADGAWERLRRGDTDDPFTLVPIYLHRPGVPHP